MPDLLSMLEKSREAILLGEFGGLLHMFGKASREFLAANSIDGSAADNHQVEKHFDSLLPLLQQPNLSDRFTLASERLKEDFTDFFRKYKGRDPDSHLLWLFNTCHRMTSADEKGVVRREQSINAMRITTPFGREVQTVQVDRIDASRVDMAWSIAAALQDYLDNRITVEQFRERAIDILKPGLSQTLGETREPANDVTLWAQSYGVASLYKSTLASVALGKDPCPGRNRYNDVRWRLLGIGWNGAAFVQRGRMPADILERQSVLARVRRAIVNQLEVQTPVGNLFYADLNGVFFTFPGIDKDASCELLKGAGPGLIEIIRQESDNELWPFLTLSRPRRTLTSIAQQISNRDRLGAAPCTAAALNLEDDGSYVTLAAGPCLASPPQSDVCPVCRVRDKAPSAEACGVCRGRRSGRQSNWLQDTRGETIWVNEIADAGNRLALLTLRIDVKPWLSGEQFSTILTQTVAEWSHGSRITSAKRRLKEFIDKGQLDPGDARSIAGWATVPGNRTRTECKAALESFMENGEITDVPAFFVELQDAQGSVSGDAVLSHFFTQNPSPGRLMRIWEAADTCVESLTESLRTNIFASRPLRVSFRTSTPIAGVEPSRTYRLTIPELRGGPIVVLAKSRQDFLTADNLGKFGNPDALQRALSKNGVLEWRDEETGDLVSGPTPLSDVSLESGYLPFTVLARSPAFSQILLPAGRVSDVLRVLLELEKSHFGAVRGKLALHAGVLVAKRNFPLYALVEAGQQIVHHASLNEGRLREPWFVPHAIGDFYRQYPAGQPTSRGHEFSNLAPLEPGRQYWLTEGYFDFDYLGGTVDRHRLRYDVGVIPCGRLSAMDGYVRARCLCIASAISSESGDCLSPWDRLNVTKSRLPLEPGSRSGVTSRLRPDQSMRASLAPCCRMPSQTSAGRL